MSDGLSDLLFGIGIGASFTYGVMRTLERMSGRRAGRGFLRRRRKTAEPEGTDSIGHPGQPVGEPTRPSNYEIVEEGKNTARAELYPAIKELELRVQTLARMLSDVLTAWRKEANEGDGIGRENQRLLEDALKLLLANADHVPPRQSKRRD
jgi:hypothetical protein